MLLSAAKQLLHIFNHKRLPISVKTKTFDVYLSTIFLYNSEIWTLSESLIKKVDSFQRRMLRTFVLNIKYPKTMNNKEVYQKTNQKPWSKNISIRRIKWLGHVCRLDPRTPARKSLKYAIDNYRRKVGRPKLTWISIINKQLKDLNINLNEVINIAQDKTLWFDVVKRATECS